MINEIVEILTDPGHLVAEFIFEGCFFLASVGYVKMKLKKRDARHSHS